MCLPLRHVHDFFSFTTFVSSLRLRQGFPVHHGLECRGDERGNSWFWWTELDRSRWPTRQPDTAYQRQISLGSFHHTEDKNTNLDKETLHVTRFVILERKQIRKACHRWLSLYCCGWDAFHCCIVSTSTFHDTLTVLSKTSTWSISALQKQLNLVVEFDRCLTVITEINSSQLMEGLKSEQMLRGFFKFPDDGIGKKTAPDA